MGSSGDFGAAFQGRAMTLEDYQNRRERLFEAHEELIGRRNEPLPESNGWFQRYRHPVLSAAHAPLFWRYDLSPDTNRHLMERLGVNALFNVGGMGWHGGAGL